MNGQFFFDLVRLCVKFGICVEKINRGRSSHSACKISYLNQSTQLLSRTLFNNNNNNRMQFPHISIKMFEISHYFTYKIFENFNTKL